MRRPQRAGTAEGGTGAPYRANVTSCPSRREGPPAPKRPGGKVLGTRLRRPFSGRFVLKAVPGPTDVRPMRSVRPSTHQAAVLALLRRGPMHLDALCRELT